MGELVPMGEIWRAGANENSTLSFSDPVKVGGENLDAGTYSLFIRPGKSMWEVFFYTETDNWGLPEKWNTESIAVVVETEIIQLKNTIESFTISLDDLYNNGANINIKWENTKVSIPIEVPTHSKMMSSITKTIKKDPKSRDYYNAAIYYRQSNQDLNQAKKWIAKAIEMDPDKFWMYRQQSLILAQLNEKDIAIAAAKTSLKLAQEAGNMDYVRLNTKSIKEWSN
jgi:tetratricopeptide (TPR) repeat protein